MKVGKVAATALAAGLVFGLAGGVMAHGARHATHRHRASPAKMWLRVRKAHKQVTFIALAGYGGTNAGENFDGYAKGRMVLVVPVGWTVRVQFKNVSELPHSIVFEPWKESMNSQSPVPAFKGAETPNPVDGTPSGSHNTFHFRANKVGKYRMICAFPGHAALGMWDRFVVTKHAKVPTIKV